MLRAKQCAGAITVTSATAWKAICRRVTPKIFLHLLLLYMYQPEGGWRTSITLDSHQ